MGIPKFFRWISERYPLINQDISEDSITPEFDNLYLDFNGVIHRCTHPDDGAKSLANQLTLNEMVLGMFQYVDQLFRLIRPKQMLMIAVDGVAPRAKMNQQRSRRFRSAREAKAALEEAKSKGMEIPDNEADIFDSNCITPGTDFMFELSQYFEYFFRSKISDDPAWKNVKVIFSGQDVPGEGEHKIMEYIRRMKAQDDWDPNTKHCMYGLDADLIMLSLVTHEPHFSLLREEVYSRKKGNFGSNAQGFQMLHISILREYLDHEFRSSTVPFGYDLERVIDDFVFICYFIGNDFLPNLPFLDIADNALNRIFDMYKTTLPKLEGYLTNKGEMNMRSVEAFIVQISAIEKECLETIAYQGGNFEHSKGKNKQTFSSGPVSADFDFTSAGAADVPLPADAQLNDEEGETAQEHLWKNTYYMSKFESSLEDEDSFDKLKFSYLEGLAWVLHYYYDGVVSWGWYYPYHYAPLASDLRELEEVHFEFTLGDPFRPFQQLLSVLPIASSKFLPASYRTLMSDKKSPLHPFYPTDFELDQNGKKNEWEAVVIIPFIDADILLEASNAIGEDQLTERELMRNSNEGHPLLFYYNTNDRETYVSPFQSLLGDIYDCATSVERFAMPPSTNKCFDLCPGVKMGIDAPACFPTLYTLPHSAAPEFIGVTVFHFGSKRESMKLTLHTENAWAVEAAPVVEEVESEELGISIEELDRRDREEQAKKAAARKARDQKEVSVAINECNRIGKELLGKVVYVDWPYHREAKVVEVVSRYCKLTKQSGNEPIKSQNLTMSREHEKFWRKQTHVVSSTFKFKKAVDPGELQVLVRFRQIKGLKLLPNGKLAKEFVLANDYYPYQAIVTEIHNRDRRYDTSASVEELFKPTTPVVVTSKKEYGSVGFVKSVDGDQVEVEYQPARAPLEIGHKLTGAARPQTFSMGQVASRLGCNSATVSKICGSVYVDPKGQNIGLGIKFSGKNQKVQGYTEKTEGRNTWLFTAKAVELLSEYRRLFPEVFTVLPGCGSGKPNVKKLFGKNSNDRMKALNTWLKKSPVKSLPRIPTSYYTFTSGQIGALQGGLDEAVQSGKLNEQEAKVETFSAKDLLRPVSDELNVPAVPYDLGDRVLYVKKGGKAPFGYKGCVVGSDKVNGVISVLFDKQFIGGSNLHGACAPLRALEHLAPRELINLSTTPHTKKKRAAYKQGDFKELRSSGSGGKQEKYSQQPKVHPNSQPKAPQPKPNEQHAASQAKAQSNSKGKKQNQQNQQSQPKQVKQERKQRSKGRKAQPAPNEVKPVAGVPATDPSQYWMDQLNAGSAAKKATPPAKLTSPEDFGKALSDLLQNPVPQPVAHQPPAVPVPGSGVPPAANAGADIMRMLMQQQQAPVQPAVPVSYPQQAYVPVPYQMPVGVMPVGVPMQPMMQPMMMQPMMQPMMVPSVPAGVPAGVPQAYYPPQPYQAPSQVKPNLMPKQPKVAAPHNMDDAPLNWQQEHLLTVDAQAKTGAVSGGKRRSKKNKGGKQQQQ